MDRARSPLRVPLKNRVEGMAPSLLGLLLPGRPCPAAGRDLRGGGGGRGWRQYGGGHELEEGRRRRRGRRRGQEMGAAALRRELLPRPALHRQVSIHTPSP